MTRYVSACNAGDPGSIPGSGRSPGEGNDNPLQDSCLKNPWDRGVWWATVHKVAKNQTQLSNRAHTHFSLQTIYGHLLVQYDKNNGIHVIFTYLKRKYEETANYHFIYITIASSSK